MDLKTAIQILSYLADGIDPYTGAVLSNESPFQKADTVRALNVGIQKLVTAIAKEQKMKEKPCHAGMPWTKEEDEELIKGFDVGISIKELSEKHGRTKGAIQSRLVRLGKIE